MKNKHIVIFAIIIGFSAYSLIFDNLKTKTNVSKKSPKPENKNNNEELNEIDEKCKGFNVQRFDDNGKTWCYSVENCEFLHKPDDNTLHYSWTNCAEKMNSDGYCKFECEQDGLCELTNVNNC